MDYILTNHRQYSKTDKDGKDRNYSIYFLNGIQILKQKIPFDTNWDRGFDRRMGIYDPYILNFNIDDVKDNDEMWVGNIVVEEGGYRFTDSVHSGREVCSPEEFLEGAHQLPSDFKNKTSL